MSGFLFLITVLFWGSTWIAITFQLTHVATEISLVYRFGAASLIFFALAYLKKQRLRLSLNDHLFLVLLGVLMFGLNYLLTYAAAKSIPSGLLATIFSLAPMANIVFDYLFFKKPIEPPMVIGAAIGTFGIGLIFWPELTQFNLNQGTLVGLFFCLFAILFFSLGSMVSVRNHRAGLPVLSSNAYGMLYGTFLFIFVAQLRGNPFVFDTSPAYVYSLAYLIVVGTVLSFFCYLTLIARIGPSKAAYTSIFFPIVALILSTLYEGFVWTPLNFLGVAIALSSSLFVLGKRQLKQTEKEVAEGEQAE